MKKRISNTALALLATLLLAVPLQSQAFFGFFGGGFSFGFGFGSGWDWWGPGYWYSPWHYGYGAYPYYGYASYPYYGYRPYLPLAATLPVAPTTKAEK